MLPPLSVAYFIADFGELVAIAPAALAIGVFLALDGRRHLAIVWGQSFLLAIGAAGLGKLMQAPVSGHAAVALAFEGGVAVLLWRNVFGLDVAGRILAAMLVALAATICWSVWALGWHGMTEIIIGALAGALVPMRLAYIELQAGDSGQRRMAALLAVVVLVAGLHGLRLDQRADRPRLSWNGVVVIPPALSHAQPRLALF